jgi:hypothetical protein
LQFASAMIYEAFPFVQVIEMFVILLNSQELIMTVEITHVIENIITIRFSCVEINRDQTRYVNFRN